MTLLKAEANTEYRVVLVSKEQADTRRRLLEMGFTSGSKVKVCGIAPFDKTVLVAIRGAMVALRSQTAALIHIEKISSKVKSV